MYRSALSEYQKKLLEDKERAKREEAKRKQARQNRQQRPIIYDEDDEKAPEVEEEQEMGEDDHDWDEIADLLQNGSISPDLLEQL